MLILKQQAVYSIYWVIEGSIAAATVLMLIDPKSGVQLFHLMKARNPLTHIILTGTAEIAF
jgi:hypothetical protein